MKRKPAIEYFDVVSFQETKPKKTEKKREKKKEPKESKKERQEGRKKKEKKKRERQRKRKRKRKRGRPKKAKGVEKERETLKIGRKCPFLGENKVFLH